MCNLSRDALWKSLTNWKSCPFLKAKRSFLLFHLWFGRRYHKGHRRPLDRRHQGGLVAAVVPPCSIMSLPRAVVLVYVSLTTLLDFLIFLSFVTVSIRCCHWETSLARNKATSVLRHISRLAMKRIGFWGVREKTGRPPAMPPRVASPICVGRCDSVSSPLIFLIRNCFLAVQPKIVNLWETESHTKLVRDGMYTRLPTWYISKIPTSGRNRMVQSAHQWILCERIGGNSEGW